MRVAIHQPNFLPRPKTVAKILAAERLIILDDVQFALAEWQNRARIYPLHALAGREWFWLTLPLHRPQGRATPINECRLVDLAAAKEQALRSLRMAFGSSPWWGEIDEFVSGPIAAAAGFPALATETMIAAARALGWDGDVLHSSAIAVRAGRNERLVDLCQAAGASVYVAGSGGRRYLDQYLFRKASIDVEFCELAPGLDLGCTVPLDAAIVSHLVRIGREALGNALRAAAAASQR